MHSWRLRFFGRVSRGDVPVWRIYKPRRRTLESNAKHRFSIWQRAEKRKERLRSSSTLPSPHIFLSGVPRSRALVPIPIPLCPSIWTSLSRDMAFPACLWKRVFCIFVFRDSAWAVRCVHLCSDWHVRACECVYASATLFPTLDSLFCAVLFDEIWVFFCLPLLHSRENLREMTRTYLLF